MFHLIAQMTVRPTLRSAREYCEQPRPPKFLKSDADPLECFNYLKKQITSMPNGAGAKLINDGRVPNGLPVHITEHWTYHIIDDTE